MNLDTSQIDTLLSDHKNFIKVTSSEIYMNSLTFAIGDFINLRELMTLRFIEQFSTEQLSEYYQVGTMVIENWLGKIYRITLALIRKNIIRFDS